MARRTKYVDGWPTLSTEELRTAVWPSPGAEAVALPGSRRRARSDLERKLLAVGGAFVKSEPIGYSPRIAAAGRLFAGIPVRVLTGKQDPMEHLIDGWFAARTTRSIVVGCVLTRDGGWSRHGWLWDGSQVYDPSETHFAYYGLVLPQIEALNLSIAQFNLLMNRRQESGADT